MTLPAPPVPPAGAPGAVAGSTDRGRPAFDPAAVVGLYRLLLRSQLTTGRLLLAGIMGGLALLLAFLINNDPGPQADAGVVTVEVLSVFGMGLMVPILTLVMASSTFGQLVDDETLVYLWIRPNQRWLLALAAWLASATVAVPLTVIPLALATAVGSGGDTGKTVAMAVAVALAAVGYTSLFTFVGLVVRRALILGLVYVFIWEFFVARVGAGAARLSLNTYPSSVLARMAEVDLPLANRAMSTGVLTPIILALVMVALTGWRLNRMTVA